MNHNEFKIGDEYSYTSASGIHYIEKVAIVKFNDKEIQFINMNDEECKYTHPFSFVRKFMLKVNKKQYNHELEEEVLSNLEPVSCVNDSSNNGGDKKNPTPEYYGAKCKCGRKIDWYVIGDLYRKEKGEAWSHSCKKLLRAGEGHKSLLKDINEVIDSLNRWKEQIKDKE